MFGNEFITDNPSLVEAKSNLAGQIMCQTTLLSFNVKDQEGGDPVSVTQQLAAPAGATGCLSFLTGFVLFYSDNDDHHVKSERVWINDPVNSNGTWTFTVQLQLCDKHSKTKFSGTAGIIVLWFAPYWS